MPNICVNRLEVDGPEGDVRAFVDAAYGPYDPEWAGSKATEKGILRAVRDGMDVVAAFDQAKDRLARLRLVHLGASNDRGGTYRPPSIPEGVSFGAWSRWVGFDVGEPGGARSSHLSLPSLVPVPPEVLAESFDYLGCDWTVSHWGVKWGIGADRPEVSVDGASAKAVYASFDTPTAPPVGALESISRARPSLKFRIAFMAEGEEGVHVEAVRDGEVVAALSGTLADFPGPEGDDAEEPVEGVTSVGAVALPAMIDKVRAEAPRS